MKTVPLFRVKALIAFSLLAFSFSFLPQVSAQCTLSATTSTIQNVLCNGGRTGNAQANITGGTSPFTYSWSNGSSTVSTSNPTGTVLSAGGYTVTVRDANSCSATATVIITQPIVLSVSIGSQTNINCNGNTNGSLTASIPGGTIVTKNFSYTRNIQNYTIPAGVTTITMTTNGGRGGSGYGTSTAGRGASLTAVVSVIAGDVIAVVVADSGTNGGGGGGTYIYDVTNSNTLLMVAGGGGGGSPYPYSAVGGPGGTDPGGLVTHYSVYQGADGTGGNGGVGGVTYGQFGAGSGGAGWLSNGDSVYGPGNNNPSYGGACMAHGFGGGGSGGGYGGGGGAAYNAGGGGGGYNGGGGGDTQPVDGGGDGGGSYINLTYGTLSGSITATNYGLGSVSFQYTAPTAGTPPYTYVWTPNVSTTSSASGLSVGTYTINVTDANGCTASVSTTITQPNVFAMSAISVTNITCNGSINGAASITPAGGGTPFTYFWSTGATTSSISGLSAGTYSVSVQDACGGSGTASTTITQPSSPLADGTPTLVSNVNCYGGFGSATAATPTGGTSPYTYRWNYNTTFSPTDNTLSAGTYTIIITDVRGCSATASATIIITQPAAALAGAISAHSDLTCYGANNGSATINPSGGTSPYTFSWTPSGGTNASASNLSQGTYSVSIWDNHGCSSSVGVTISQPTQNAISVVSETNLSGCSGNTGSATAALSTITITKTFNYISSIQNWTVPAGVTTLTITANGGQGGGTGASGGKGASFSGICSVTPGHILSIIVGGQGTTVTYGGGGGGATWIYDSTVTGAHTGTPSISALLIAAAGGGGADNLIGNAGAAAGINLVSNAATSSGGSAAGGINGNGGSGGTGTLPRAVSF